MIPTRRLSFLLFVSMLPAARVSVANSDLICRDTSVETPDDIRREVYCMRRGLPPPFFAGSPSRPPSVTPREPAPPPASSANPFDRNSDGKMDCWKDAVGPANKTEISSRYGGSDWRDGNWHYGVDLVSRTGNFGLAQPVRAIADGNVVRGETSSANGNFVEIVHSDGRASMYIHLKEITRRDGAVRAGDVIGSMNCTGLCGRGVRRNSVRSTHVHLEVKTAPGTERLQQNRIDPVTYLGECT